MKYLVLLGLMIGQMASASVTKKFKIHFQGDFGVSAQSIKRQVAQQIPYIFSRYVRDVKWKITRQGKAWIQVDLEGQNRNRIDGWLYTIQAETQDSIAGIQEVR